MSKKPSGSNSAESPKSPGSADSAEPQIVDINDLTYQGGYAGDPREIVTDPAVAPRAQDDSEDDRGHFTEPPQQNQD